MKPPVDYTLTFDGDERNEARILAGLDGCGGAFRELITINTADPVIRRHASVFFARLMSALHEIDALEEKLPERGAKCGTCGGDGEFEIEALICPTCRGSGRRGHRNRDKCPGCDGSGEIAPAHMDPCPDCAGGEGA